MLTGLDDDLIDKLVERYLSESYADPEEGRRSIRSRQLGGDLGTSVFGRVGRAFAPFEELVVALAGATVFAFL